MKTLTVAALILVILVIGCIDTTVPVIGKPSVEIGTPYNIGAKTIAFSIDTNISVPITNTRNDVISIEILDATLTATMNNGTTKIIHGTGNSIIIPSKQSSNILVRFRGVPSIYKLEENPLRLVSEISSYSISVYYKGTVNVLFGLAPYSISDVYTRIIPVTDIPINTSLFVNTLVV